MQKSFFQFCRQSLKDFFEMAANLVVFLPYFLSISTLLKTLFSPWKNLQAKKTIHGFSLEEWFNRFSFNLISRLIGLIMRLLVIIFYLTAQFLFFLFIPIFFLFYLLALPLLFIKMKMDKTEAEKKDILKKKFISNHLLQKENQMKVEQWFENYYRHYCQKSLWWKKSNLFSIPPLARDWAMGYTPTLDEYADDLTSPAYQTRMKNIVDREKEIDEIERVLSKTDEANVIIVGEEGVGKHTIVDALAKKIYEGKTDNRLMYKRLLKLNMEKILTQFTDQKQREFFLEELLKEAEGANNVILMIDDLDKYVSDGNNRTDLSIPLEKYGKTSSLQIIGITTPFFYQKFIFINEKINRIFTKVDVYEVSKENAEQILLQTTPIFESRHDVFIPYETIKNTIEKSEFYVTYIPFPEKALDLLDSACVYAKKVAKNRLVSPDFVDKILSEKTHIKTSLTPEMKDKLVNLEALLRTQIVGQEEAIGKLAAALRRSFVQIGQRKKPMATFIFLGPTGVGKTETAKTIAKTFFGSEKYLIRFDMSSYQRKEDIPVLIGSMETGNPGLLAAKLRENPYGVLLLDELEKADKDLINIFLTVIDEGYFTDGFGKKVDCKNLVIIATSNAASDVIFRKATTISNSKENLINVLVEENFFSPEFLNRFDGIIIYQPLDQQSIFTITKRMIDHISENIYKLYKVKLTVSENFIAKLVNKGYDQKFGARNMERVVREEVEDKVSKLILENKLQAGQILELN